jgi:hypothetical protein
LPVKPKLPTTFALADVSGPEGILRTVMVWRDVPCAAAAWKNPLE